MRDFAIGRVPHWATRVLLVALLAFAACSYSRAESVSWQPTKLTSGSPVLFRIAAPASTREISGKWLGHVFSFFRVGKTRIWCALAGVPLQTPIGTYTLQITETLSSGRTLALKRQLRVLRASYPRITVKVAKKFTEPNHSQLTAIAADKSQKEKTFTEVSPDRLWSGPFATPVSAPVSDLFGTERVFNKEVQSRHQGLDFAVPAGTAVRAVNRGIVVLARPMYFEGNFIVIDHGQGLLSLYLHLSEFKVKEGEQVRSGQVIGLSGGTGRATGAHLHLAIRWQGVYLSPAVLLKLPIPVE